MNVFFDTNILLDVLAKRYPFYEESSDMWSLAESGRIDGFVSVISLPNLYYLLRKWSNHRKAREGLQIVRDVFHLVPCDERMVTQAIEADFPDFEDAIQFFSALRANADYIVTRDGRGFAKSSIPAVTPAEFLAHYHRR